MSSKRRNQNGQQSREELEDEEDNEDDDQAPVGTWQKASSETIAKRRIVRVSHRPTASSSSSAAAAANVNPFAPAVASSGASANPFAKIQLPPTVSAANPFATLPAAPRAGAFGAASTTSAASTNFFNGGSSSGLFGGGPPVAVKPLPARNDSSSKVARCNRAFLAWIKKQSQANPDAAWTAGVRDYLNHVESLSEAAPEKDHPPPPPKAAPLFAAAPAPAPAAPLFGGGPPTSAPLFAAAPAPSFSFGGGAPPPAAALPSFSFGGGAPPPPAPQGGEDEEGMPLEAPAEVLRGDDGDEVACFESRAGMKRLDKTASPPAWKDMGKGILRVMEHKHTKARRVVVRNDVGKVALNFALAPAMKLQKTKAGCALTAMGEDGKPAQYLIRTKEPVDQNTFKPAQFVN